jgi:beta-barrel assembly-enhancing protease
MTFPGTYFDGVSSERCAVSVSFGERGLILSEPDGGPFALWPFAAVERAEDEAEDGAIRLVCDAARLRVQGADFAAALRAAAPALAPRSPRGRALRSLVLIALGVTIGLAGWWQVPRLDAPIAALVPHAWEARLGAQTMALMGGTACTGEAGKAALDRLAARLSAGISLPQTIQVDVSDRKEINAFAAPGGHIVLFAGLINFAASPDEVAGVLAHEMSHSRKRHPTRLLIRQIGTVFLQQLLLGADTGNMAQTLLVLSYSRQFEEEADEGAIDLLRQAGIDTASFANFFDRLEKAGSRAGVPALLATHPAPQQRSAMVRAHPVVETAPAFNDADWAAVKAICQVAK